MEKSKVYYTSMRTGFDNGLLDKLKRLITSGEVLIGVSVSKTLILTENILPLKCTSESPAIWHFSAPIMQK